MQKTNIYSSNTNLEELCTIVNNELENINKWFALNKLSLNVEKTKFMVIGNKKIHGTINVKINNITLERVSSIQFLGVYIDDKLNWKSHIKYVNSKLSKCISIIYRASFLVSKYALRMLYCALFLPYIMYCCEIWGNTYRTNIESTILLQKKCIRIVCGKGRLDHTNMLFYDQKLLKFINVIELKTAILMYKAYNYILPDTLQYYFELDNNNYYNTRKTFIYKEKFTRTVLKTMCISILGVKLWNNLHPNIRNSNSIFIFKKHFKSN